MYNKSMKNKILEILNLHFNEYVSGEEICKNLNVSRAAIWKNIKKLQEEGYIIESSTKKGYCLKSIYDPLDENTIQQDLPCFYKKITILKEVDSTNEEMKRLSSSLQEGDILLAECQTKGKGRSGRLFHSPKHNGMYMSIFLKPTFSITQSLKITACTSCAVYDAIKELYNLDASIKWVNDVFIKDKKIAGILCEASLEMNTASLDYMIIGIGLNIHTYEQIEELKTIAASIEDFTDKIVSRNEIIHKILERFYYYYRTINENTFLPIYKQNSYVLNQTIDVYSQNEVYKAKALDIDENAHLLVEKEDGTQVLLNSGEISIRKQKGEKNEI